MNLDDFIFAENAATPIGAALTPTPETTMASEEKSAHSVTSAIPIKSRKEPAQQQQLLVPQSVPVPPHHPKVQDEFGYVTRHHRKTSIDDRRVSVPLFGVQSVASSCTLWYSATALSFPRRQLGLEPLT